MKRLLTLMLILLSLCFAFASCDKNDDDGDNNSQEGTSSEESSSEEVENGVSVGDIVASYDFKIGEIEISYFLTKADPEGYNLGLKKDGEILSTCIMSSSLVDGSTISFLGSGIKFELDGKELKFLSIDLSSDTIGFVSSYEMVAGEYNPNDPFSSALPEGIDPTLILGTDGKGSLGGIAFDFYPLSMGKILIINEDGEGLLLNLIGDDIYAIPMQKFAFSYTGGDIATFYELILNPEAINYYGDHAASGCDLFVLDGKFAAVGTVTGTGEISNATENSAELIINDVSEEIFLDNETHMFDFARSKVYKSGEYYIIFYKNPSLYASVYTEYQFSTSTYTPCPGAEELGIIAIYEEDFDVASVYDEDLNLLYIVYDVASLPDFSKMTKYESAFDDTSMGTSLFLDDTALYYEVLDGEKYTRSCSSYTKVNDNILCDDNWYYFIADNKCIRAGVYDFEKAWSENATVTVDDNGSFVIAENDATLTITVAGLMTFETDIQ